MCSGVCDSAAKRGRPVQNATFPKTYWWDTLVLPATVLMPARTNYTLKLTTDIPVIGLRVRV
jgi:hypothetical protein